MSTRKKATRLFFLAASLSIVFSLLVSPIAYAQIPLLPNGLLDRPSTGIETGYAYGYWSDGTVGYGYNTYRDPMDDPFDNPDWYYNPVKDTEGLYANGSLLKLADDPTIFLVQEGSLRVIYSAAVFNSWGFDWNAIKTVTDQELYSKYPPAFEQPLLGFRPGTLVKVPRDPAIYVVDIFGLFDLIPDMDTFNTWGFDINAVMEVPLPEILFFGIGPTVASTTGFNGILGLPTGLPFKGSGPEVYVMDLQLVNVIEGPIPPPPPGGASADGIIIPIFNGQFAPVIWKIMSPASFESWNFSWNGILTMSDYELTSWLNDPEFFVKDMWLQPGTLVKSADDPGVYISDYLAVQTNQPVSDPEPDYAFVRRCITSPAVFDSQGFVWGNIMTEDGNVLSSIARGRDIMPHTADFSASD